MGNNKLPRLVVLLHVFSVLLKMIFNNIFNKYTRDMDFMTFRFIRTYSQDRICGDDTNSGILGQEWFCSDDKFESKSWKFVAHELGSPA